MKWSGFVQEDLGKGGKFVEGGKFIGGAKIRIISNVNMPEELSLQTSKSDGYFHFDLPDSLREREVRLHVDAEKYKTTEPAITIHDGASETIKLVLQEPDAANIGQAPTPPPTDKSKASFVVTGDVNSSNFEIHVPRGQNLPLSGQISDYIWGPNGPIGETQPQQRTLTANSSFRFEPVIDANGAATRIHVDRDPDPNAGAVYVIRRPLKSVTNIDEVLQKISAVRN